MKFNMKHQILAVIAVIVTIIVAACFQSGKAVKLNMDVSHVLNEGWHQTGTEEVINLPVKINGPVNTTYSISRELDERFNVPQTLRVRSSLQNLTVDLNGKLIYQYTKAENTIPFASLWHLVDIPKDSQGSMLTIATLSPFDSMSGRFSEIVYGSQGDVLLDLIRQFGLNFFLSAVILIMGLAIVLLAFIVGRNRFLEVVYLGLFSIFIAIWFLAESRMLQFITGNVVLHGSLAYWMLNLFSVPLILYIRETVAKKTKPFYTRFAILLVGNFFLMTLLQTTNIAHYFQTIVITHLLMLGSGIMAIVTLLVESKKYGNVEARHFLYSIAIFLVFAVLELGYFYFNDFNLTSVFIKIGLVLFIVIQTAYSVNRLVILLKKSYEAEWYEKMAYEDRLTGSKNRMAFELDFEAFFDHPSQMNGLRLMLLDINDLKKINDQFGHVSGDLAIRIGYDAIQDAFGALGECYRIGGDEFACLMPLCDENAFYSKQKHFYQILHNHAAHLSFPLKIALGSIVYDASVDLSVSEMMHRADLEMYADKRKKKAFE